MSEETRESKINESYRITYREYSTRTYEVRAKDEDEVDNCCPDELEIIYDDTEYDDSERDEVTRFLSEGENEERLAHHKLWKAGEPLGEQYYVAHAQIERDEKFSITPEHHGAVFEECRFFDIPFEGVDFNKIEFINCDFSAQATLHDCKGLEVKEIAKPGDLWFQSRNDFCGVEKKYIKKLVPVIIKKYIVTLFKHSRLKLDFEGICNGMAITHDHQLQKDAIL